MNADLLLKGQYKLTSPFAMRYNPVTHIYEMHNGNDYGTYGKFIPVYSPFDGVVVKKGIDQFGGLYFYINYGEYVGLFYHCSKIYIKLGQKVTAGQQVALTGDTGRVDGIHLHYGHIKNNSKALDYYNADYVDWEEELVNEKEITDLVYKILSGADSEPSEWAKESFERATKFGITDGKAPKKYTTKEEVITMMDRSTPL